jgi:NAD(P)-dependent dehydrogenase (short-subunit alcohol dehydrogenase family)
MIKFKKEDIFLVTGASSGIGQGVASRLNELGATVIGIGRNQERLNELKQECKYPENMFLENKDLTENIEELPQYVKSLKEKYGKFQGMAYCAGISEVKPLQIIDLDNAKKMFDINYFAPLFMAKSFADKRNNNGKGSAIVFISSISALKSDKGHTVYAGSKAAIAASAKCIARELAGTGVRVNCVSPSDIKTPMNVDKTADDELNYPLGFGEVSDVTNMIVYLLSDKAKWITTQNYVIDCGYM